jgi:hypothetical protein
MDGWVSVVFVKTGRLQGLKMRGIFIYFLFLMGLQYCEGCLSVS